jgi:hypothetical protein
VSEVSRPTGRYIKEFFDTQLPLDHHRQPSIVLAAGGGGQAVDHLLLQHEQHVLDAGSLVEQVKQQGRGDVVGQIANQTQFPACRCKRAEVESQGIGFVHDQFPCWKIATQVCGQIAVQFDHMQRRAALEQRPGERPRTGADLDQGFARLRIERIEDALHDAAVVQEVLAEALLGLNAGHKIFSHR